MGHIVYRLLSLQGRYCCLWMDSSYKMPQNKLIIEWNVARVKFASIQLQFDWISFQSCRTLTGISVVQHRINKD